jgi:4'-phosphopantetheinyl transferase
MDQPRSRHLPNTMGSKDLGEGGLWWHAPLSDHLHRTDAMVPRRISALKGVELWIVERAGGDAESEERGASRKRLSALLSEPERARASRFRVQAARNGFIVSRGVLRQILGDELDCAPESLEFGEGEYGKPFLAGRHLGCGLEFNVAHSGEVLLYAVARGRVVGVDVERHRQSLDVEKLAERYFAPGEVKRLLADGAVEDRLDNFYRCWTRKEAYLKALGTGLTTKLDAFEVTLLRGEPPRLLSTDVSGDAPGLWQFLDVPVPAGYTAALAVRK